MKTLIPIIVLVILYLLFLVSMLLTPAFLAEKVATSFNGDGAPECWMSRTAYMAIDFGVGTYGIVMLVGLGYACRFMSSAGINKSKSKYWFAPEHCEETSTYIFRHTLWLASWMCCLLIAINISSIRANLLTPPHLPQTESFTIIGCFLAGMLIWVLKIVMHFRRGER